jgi:hypothetical protein
MEKDTSFNTPGNLLKMNCVECLILINNISDKFSIFISKEDKWNVECGPNEIQIQMINLVISCLKSAFF